ncbi:MAG: methionyl-tRNA formyltransferase [Pirellulaceae bacterium]|nr:methionyl-tRNA formyltransferase [Pirellulaceae bacterium]
MRILMMGTGGFAIPTFKALLESEHEVVGLVTRPPRPIHGRRASTPSSNPMRDLAEERGLAVTMPASINDASAVAELAEQAIDLHIVCDYGQILSNAALATARLGGINLHASLLPKYRGAAPINWAIYEGEPITGVTVIHMTVKLDAGPNLVQLQTDIGETEDAIDLEARLAETGVSAVLAAIGQLGNWNGQSSIGEIQDPQQATKAPRLKKKDGRVDWSRTADEIFNQVRAFRPWPGTYTEWQTGKKTMRLALNEVEVAAPIDLEAAPGQIGFIDRSQTVVACGKGGLRLIQVQPAGKKPMPVADFLRGSRLTVGDSIG